MLKPAFLLDTELPMIALDYWISMENPPQVEQSILKMSKAKKNCLDASNV